MLNNDQAEDQVSVLFHAEICVHSVKAHYIIPSNKSDWLFYMLYVWNTNYEATPENRPEWNHFDFENKVDFLLHKVTLRSSTCSFGVEKPLSTNSKCDLRQRVRVIQGDHVIRASWWRDHATFINRSAINTNNKGQKSRQNQTWSPKMRICFPPEDTECSACITPTRTTRTACLVWERHYPVTRLLLSDKLKGHSHVFVGHVVVVVKDRWDALLILRQLQTTTISNQFGQKINSIFFAVSCIIGQKHYI